MVVDYEEDEEAGDNSDETSRELFPENPFEDEKTEAKRNKNSTDRVYQDGDLVWAHITGFPYWPALVIPLEGEKLSLKLKNKTAQYSVVFFDDGRFGWVSEKNLLPYQGEDQLEQLKKQKLALCNLKTPKLVEKALRRRWGSVTGARREFYGRAVALAEALQPLNCADRCLRLKRTRGRLEIVSREEAEQLASQQKREQGKTTPAAERRLQKKRRSEVTKSKKRKGEKIVAALGLAKRRKREVEEENSDEEDSEDELAFMNILFSEPACFECCERIEERSEVVKCVGFCKRSFHRACTGAADTKSFLCPLCSTGKAWCFACKDLNNPVETFGCKKKCSRHYHLECLEQRRIGDMTPSPQKPRALRCPLHLCVSCMARDNPQKARRGRMLECLLCPTAYHRTEVCVPAGALLINQDHLVCPAHYDRSQAASSGNTHLNVDYCFDCGSGGKLVCCETCPLAYHEACLKTPVRENEPWRCCFCRDGFQPMFNDLVWAKLGNYRWWPAKVLHPNDIPENFAIKQHSAGEFVVGFLGSGDHAYLTQGRVFLFDEKDSNTRGPDASKGLGKSYAKALEMAKEELAAKRERNRAGDERKALKNGNRTPFFNIPHFKTLTANRFKDKALACQREEEEIECSCSASNPCTSDKTCSNRAMQIECDPKTCPAGDRCQNQRFRKAEYANTMAYATNAKGWGLRALHRIPSGGFVSEYTGEVIDQEGFRERWKRKTVENDDNFYFLSLDKNRLIDAGPAGNNSRFMNHSCNPNCTTLTWRVGKDIRIGIFAVREIAPGEELTFHYNFDYLDAPMKIPCHCQGPSCLGYIGKQSKESKTRAPGSMGRKRKPNSSHRRETR